jgi:hypothetical protein
MHEILLVNDKVKDRAYVDQSTNQLAFARRLLQHNHSQGWTELNKRFRNGKIPQPPLHGVYVGELIALDIAPGLTQFFQWLTSQWMPWLGKTFNAADQTGDNIFAKDSYPMARFFNPLYRGFVNNEPETYQGFVFHTYVASGLADPDRQVLKIDYGSKENPALTVRRVLDELVQLDDNLYLGKAHVRWWWGRWQTVAYFTLMFRPLH